ncbi:MAG: hypothetical protein HY563_08320 [Ignavibacteriales bacterium]|nr:hypothetical protein [Ignavibacteriales bacterium]
METYWDLIQAKVCRKCMDGDGRGNCRLPRTESCGLKESLPEVVRIARETQSGTYEDFVNALRAQVCSRCRYQLDDGTCPLRTTLECALDRYSLLVLDVIDGTQASTFSRAS